MMTLRTSRLRLRPFRLEDAAAFAAYRSDPEVARYQSWSAPFPVEAALELIGPMLGRTRAEVGEWNQLAVELEGAGLIGDCAFRMDDETTVTIGFTVARGFWGRGYAGEAAAALVGELFARGVERVRAECDWENARSRRVLERLGMAWGLVRHAVFRGRVATEVTYSIDRASWDARRGAAT